MPEGPASAPGKVSGRAWTVGEAVDGVFFVVGTVLVLWLAGVLVTKELALRPATVVYLAVFWLLTAYVGLPRLQQVLAKIYVPDYFIGRTTTSSGILGDPVNLAANGSAAQVHEAMSRAGWTRADPITLRSSWGIVVSALLRRSYDAAPVSPLLLFGRPEQFAYEQEVGGNAAQRHHVRFWPTPEGWLLPGAHKVDWLAAGTFDRAVGLSLFTLQVTHKVDADIDVERDHVVATVTHSLPAARATVLEDFVTAFHSRNGGGDVVRTDGSLVVLDLTQIAAPEAPTPEPAPKRAVTRRHLPPPALRIAGALSVLKAATGIATLGLPALSSALTLLLWGAVLARRSWARTLLMAICAVEAAVQLATTTAASQRPSLTVLLDAGVAVLILIVVSSDESRRWVRHAR